MGIATDSAERSGSINWYATPTSDIGTALSFYEHALETLLSGEIVSSERGPGIRAAGADRTGYRAVPDIAAEIERCTEAGGKALTEIIDLPAGIGRIAHMIEADGRRIGLHQPGVARQMSPLVDIPCAPRDA